MQRKNINRIVLIGVVLVISILFAMVLKPFLLSIFLAALFAALCTPLYHWFMDHLGQRRALASALTLLTVLLFVVVPLGMILGIVANQAVEITNQAVPWVQRQMETPGFFTQTLQSLPFYAYIEPYQDLIGSQLGDIVATLSSWLGKAIQSATLGTFNALLSVVIILYTTFFLLIDGDRFLYYVLYYLPLDDEDENRLLHRFTSVTRATLKGTAVIGVLQGGLAGLALHVAGIPSAMFWSVAMMLLSVVPGVGTALVWVPAVIWLAISGQYVEAVGVGAFCAVVVGSIDNLLRPKLVGNDTQLHELLIFFSTLGGLAMFGFTGFIIGPIIASLFVTVWELYGDEFSEWLPTTAFQPRSGTVKLPHQRVDWQSLAGHGVGSAAAAGELSGDAGANDADEHRPADGETKPDSRHSDT